MKSKLQRRIKQIRKVFGDNVQERMKTNSGISSLKKNDGSLAVKDIEKAETLNEFFSSVFIREDTTNVPFLNNGSMSDGISLYDIRVTLRQLGVNCRS